MKKYHLTLLRNGRYKTVFAKMTSIESFIAIERELDNDTHILYSRELTDTEWENVKNLKLF